MDVVIVLLDDVGVDEVTPYHFRGSPPTPVIQALADEGLRYDNAWATPVCSPTRAALLTGRFAYLNTVGAVIHTRQDKELPLSEITMPEMLDASGTDWTSAAVGKWHLATPNSANGTDHPWKSGFDLFSGSMANLNGETYDHYERVGFDHKLAVETTFSTTRIVDDAIEAIERMPEPFFLYVPFNAAHTPLMVPPRELTGSLVVNPNDENSLFEANVVAADHELGRLIDALGERRSRTLIVVLGDNGTPHAAQDTDGMAGAKGTFTEGGLRVPFIVVGPPVTARGESEALVSVVDLFPTLMELAGVQHVKASLDGLSLVDSFHDKAAPVHRILYSELRHPADGPPWTSVERAARDTSLKVVDQDGARTIYRLGDLDETEVRRRSLNAEEKRREAALEAEIDRH